jgi:DNA-directed RNA polymerase specialized sigma24 family protein
MLGRKKGYRPSEKHAEKVLERHRDRLSYRLIARKLGSPKNNVMAIVQRASQPAAV